MTAAVRPTRLRIARMIWAILDDPEIVADVAATLVFGTNDVANTRRSLVTLGGAVAATPHEADLDEEVRS